MDILGLTFLSSKPHTGRHPAQSSQIVSPGIEVQWVMRCIPAQARNSSLLMEVPEHTAWPRQA